MFEVHLKEILNQHGYTIYDLSNEILDLEGISESTIYRFARGEQNLTLNKLAVILAAVRSLTKRPVHLNDLICDEGSPSTENDADTSDLAQLSDSEMISRSKDICELIIEF